MRRGYFVVVGWESRGFIFRKVGLWVFCIFRCCLGRNGYSFSYFFIVMFFRLGRGVGYSKFECYIWKVEEERNGGLVFISIFESVGWRRSFIVCVFEFVFVRSVSKLRRGGGVFRRWWVRVNRWIWWFVEFFEL